MYHHSSYLNPPFYAKLRANDSASFAQAAAFFDNFGQVPSPITSTAHRPKKVLTHSQSLFETHGKLKIVATPITTGPTLQSSLFVAGKNVLFTVAEDGGILRHSLKLTNLDLTIDSRLKQGLFPHVGTIIGKNRTVFSLDGSELFVLGEEGGIRCIDSLSGSEKWRMMIDVVVG